MWSGRTPGARNCGQWLIVAENAPSISSLFVSGALHDTWWKPVGRK